MSIFFEINEEYHFAVKSNVLSKSNLGSHPKLERDLSQFNFNKDDSL